MTKKTEGEGNDNTLPKTNFGVRFRGFLEDMENELRQLSARGLFISYKVQVRSASNLLEFNSNVKYFMLGLAQTRNNLPSCIEATSALTRVTLISLVVGFILIYAV